MSLLKRKNKEEKKKVDVIVQENQQECINLVENGFLADAFIKESVTDVSYNGTSFYIQDNDVGRYRYDIDTTSEEVLIFIKKIANYMLQPFSTLTPSLDVSFGNYRLNAIHPNLARNDTNKVVTFSLRRITATLKIKDNDPILCSKEVHYLLKSLMQSYQSVLISGQTGSGKTEFQKYLISLMNEKDRIIMIEESYETHVKEIFKDRDITSWIVNNNKDELSFFVKTALRNNPEWIIVAETRGKEAYDMIQAVMTGHSAITTIHSDSAKYSLNRLTSLCKRSVDFDEKVMFSNIANHIKIGIHLERIFDEILGKYIRRISEIVEYIPNNTGFETNTIYEIIKDENLKEKIIYRPISNHLKNKLIKHNIKVKTLTKFYKEVKISEKKKSK